MSNTAKTMELAGEVLRKVITKKIEREWVPLTDEEILAITFDAKITEPNDEPIAYIKDREIAFMLGVKQVGGTYWKTSLGFTRESGDIGLYTEAQVRRLLEKQNA